MYVTVLNGHSLCNYAGKLLSFTQRLVYIGIRRSVTKTTIENAPAESREKLRFFHQPRRRVDSFS